MINSVNIDLTNKSCWGTSNDACDDNKILLYIKLLDSLLGKTDIHLEFTKPDGVIVTTNNLNIVNEQVSYELPFNLYITKGTLKLRIVATDYTSDYINFSILDNYTETDNLCVKFNTTTQEFSINKCIPSGQDILLQVYPVGSIYMNFNNINPSLLFGGTWEQIKGRFLVGCGSNGVDLYTEAGDVGGEAVHALTVEEMPKHDHRTWISDENKTETGDGYLNYFWGKGHYYNLTTETGGSQPHNNLPPYLSIYMWKRTA